MTNHLRLSAETRWYDLFSRGARDWLRHNQKMRQAVRDNLLNLIGSTDVITNPTDRTMRVPVRLLEHARFRLADAETQTGAGQGKGKPGEVLRPARPEQGDDAGQGGNKDGEVKLLLELEIDDIIDWLWDELKLPNLKPRPSTSAEEQEMVRKGWGKRGIRARLDRRRTVKAAVMRRAIQSNPVPFTDDDLRFHQLSSRPRSATNAVVICALDVSGSMGAAERQLAKTFFFFALQGIRRQYGRVETRLIAHTTQAWEFPENEFFQVSGSGGTMASSAFKLALELVRTRYDPARYNGYLFYASDGENYSDDHAAASEALRQLAALLNYIGYVETRPGTLRPTETEMHSLLGELQRSGAPAWSHVAREPDDIWQAIRHFFVQLAGASAAA